MCNSKASRLEWLTWGVVDYFRFWRYHCVHSNYFWSWHLILDALWELGVSSKERGCLVALLYVFFCWQGMANDWMPLDRPMLQLHQVLSSCIWFSFTSAYKDLSATWADGHGSNPCGITLGDNHLQLFLLVLGSSVPSWDVDVFRNRAGVFFPFFHVFWCTPKRSACILSVISHKRLNIWFRRWEDLVEYNNNSI